eukprot:356062-Chlamydomonas_euryale.AAC.3
MVYIGGCRRMHIPMHWDLQVRGSKAPAAMHLPVTCPRLNSCMHTKAQRTGHEYTPTPEISKVHQAGKRGTVMCPHLHPPGIDIPEVALVRHLIAGRQRHAHRHDALAWHAASCAA